MLLDAGRKDSMTQKSGNRFAGVATITSIAIQSGLMPTAGLRGVNYFLAMSLATWTTFSALAALLRKTRKPARKPVENASRRSSMILGRIVITSW